MNSEFPKRSGKTSSHSKGKHYEDIATLYYQRLGYDVIERNWRAKRFEIDLIVESQTQIIFVEVKGGKLEYMGHPVHRVDKRKQERLLQAAETYLSVKHTKNKDVRFDVLTVSDTSGGQKIERFENAFEKP